ncbi:MAG TPA: transglycosylase domain-containing protein [Acidimicrobiia bacterium]|nr:transglycosylase domain-containing protein [Acidimicrobiia bacterium]
MSDGAPAPHRKFAARRRSARVFRRVTAASIVVGMVVAALPPLREAVLYGATAAVLRTAERWGPDVPPFAELSADTRIVAADGRLLATLQEEHRRPLRLADVPVPVRRAVLAAEDENFYRHSGVDPLGLARAAWRNLRGGSQGGSTLTQQLAKTNFTAGARTFDRKAEEALIAGELERRHTKDELLERYLNQVYFGERAYGLDAAARTFFDVDPARLSVAQAATLAGKLRAPDGLDPRTDPTAVLRRRDSVLANMAQEGWLTDGELAAARAEPLTLAPPRPVPGTDLAPHFVELVKREAQTLKALGDDAATRLARLAFGGYRVETTLDPAAFEATVEAARGHLGRPGDPRVAAATVEPGTGAIRSVYGGPDFASHQFDQASLGSRQPGSAFKPFVYLAALRAGIDPRSTFNGRSDRRIKCYGDRRVHNAGNRSAWGRIDVDRALVQSVNVVFVDLGCEVGVESVLQAATDAGIPEGATEAQGAVFLGGLDRGVSALTMAAAYATFASGGVYAEPYAIARIVDRRGDVVYEREPVRRQAFRPEEVGVLNRILQQVVTSGTGRGADIGRPVAGKTGTSEDHGDAWFVGFVPQLSTAVWVGYEPRRPMWQVRGRAVSGGSFPAVIFAAVMHRALEGTPARPILTAEPDQLDLRRLPPPRWTRRIAPSSPRTKGTKGTTGQQASLQIPAAPPPSSGRGERGSR